MHSLLRRVFEAMLLAGWLHSFRYTLNAGWWLVWTEAGMERSACLREIADTFGLYGGDTAPALFEVACQRIRLGGAAAPGEPDRALALYFLECVEQLGFSGDADVQLATAIAVREWGYKIG